LIIKAGAGPAPLNPKSKGVLPVWLAGDSQLDLADVLPYDLHLWRGDGLFGDVVLVHQGPVNCTDAVTSTGGEPCDGQNRSGSDGFVDLGMKFDTQAVVTQLQLDEVPPGETVELLLTGYAGGTPFIASGCVKIVGGPQDG